MVRAHKRHCVITNAVIGHARTINAIGPASCSKKSKYSERSKSKAFCSANLALLKIIFVIQALNFRVIKFYFEVGKAKVPIIPTKSPITSNE